MSIVTLDQVKKHLHVDHDCEDDLITLYLNAAEDQAAKFMNRKVYASQDAIAAAGDAAGDRPIVMNDSIRAAVLLTVGHLYANREENVTGTIVSELKTGVQSLLMPYRISMGV